jgi:hypothetical protein
MESIDKIKLVTNYDEKVVDSTYLQLNYLDMVSSEDEELIRKIKQKNRELTIDAIIDDKVDEWKESKSEWLISDLPNEGEVSMKIFSMNIQSKKTEDYNKIWNEIINLINSSTKNPKKITNVSSLDVQLSNDFDVDKRRVISKIVMCSNFISMAGRIGPGNVVICGYNCIQYIDNELLGMNIVLDLSIDPNKIIVIRKNQLNQPGIILVNDVINKNYFLKETPTFIKQMCWFSIN